MIPYIIPVLPLIFFLSFPSSHLVPFLSPPFLSLSLELSRLNKSPHRLHPDVQQDLTH